MLLKTFEAESCIRGYHTYSAVLVATVGEQLQCALERRNAKDPFAVLGSHCMNGNDIVGRIPRKISRNDGETYRTLLYNDRVLEMTLDLFYVLLSTSTKIFAEKNFRESVQTREKRENLHPAKLTGYTVL